MKTAKIMSMALVMFLLSGQSFAQGYMSVNLGAQARFVYVQIIDVLDGHFTVQSDVTNKVPYEVHTIDDQKMLIIN